MMDLLLKRRVVRAGGTDLQRAAELPDPTRREFLAAAALSAVAAGQALGEPPAAVAEPEAPAAGPLADYVGRQDPATRFEPLGRGDLLGGEWLTGRLVSQRWRGVDWTHELSLFRPAAAADRGPMLLWIDGGSSGRLPAAGLEAPTDTVQTLAGVATAAGLPAAAVRQVPYQPMFDGLVEDSLIAHTFVEFVKTGDVTWPLLVPMVKAAVEAMTAASRAAADAWGLAVEGFVASGASKRGWTTWLSAAMDRRVKGLVPMVIDMLSLEAHVGLQRASFGGLSDQLGDYTSRGIEQLLATPRGRELVGIVDPLGYRDQLAQPKIIALGTNDPYWPLEACGLYFDRLEGPRWLSYAPNAGHGLPGPRVMGLVAAMGRHTAGLETLPEIDWEIERERASAVCHASCPGAAAGRAVAWTARSNSRDFRQAEWRSAAAEPDAAGWRLVLDRPAEGFVAGLIELEFPRRTLPLALTTGVAVVGRS
jgi:PhoPQ-activated pathogenicity-related protein